MDVTIPPTVSYLRPFLSPQCPFTEWTRASGLRGQCFGQGPGSMRLAKLSAGLSPLSPGWEEKASQLLFPREAHHVLLWAGVVWPMSGILDPGLEMPLLQ